MVSKETAWIQECRSIWFPRLCMQITQMCSTPIYQIHWAMKAEAMVSMAAMAAMAVVEVVEVMGPRQAMAAMEAMDGTHQAMAAMEVETTQAMTATVQAVDPVRRLVLPLLAVQWQPTTAAANHL